MILDEETLKRMLAAAESQAEMFRRELANSRFGWRSDDPPTSGVVETLYGFSSTQVDEWGTRTTLHAPGFVNVDAYPLPEGTVWRPRK